MAKRNTTQASNNEEKKVQLLFNNIVITVTAWEYRTGKKADMIKASLYAGKKQDGSYNRDIPCTIWVTDETELPDNFTINGRTRLNVTGRVSFSRRDEYININIDAQAITLE